MGSGQRTALRLVLALASLAGGIGLGVGVMVAVTGDARGGAITVAMALLPLMLIFFVRTAMLKR